MEAFNQYSLLNNLDILNQDLFGQRFTVKIVDYTGKGERENVDVIVTTSWHTAS